ncbi:hypothetical protein H1Z61_12765 [Bacillus aquiflavi]|uniref:ATP-grasp domain-containing protein n=1 Tax=Bacillus aquiflavi TaxID=2672567 RepID=A0A6B3W2V2_9BACI|nr:hypothetical protein [Bacillus aquiflavi]MBA4537980.1 hypothetical protein [Bacillus aquiflavi]NEY82236.1 hypothetical protein [Bacillus aquiflavi]
MSIEKQHILLTGGRAPVTLDLARQFHSLGHKVYVADSVPMQLTSLSNAVCKSFVITSPVADYNGFIQDLLTIIHDYKIHLLIPTCEEVFYIGKGKAQLEALCHVFCSDLHILSQLHEKFSFTELVRSKGLKAPETLLAKTSSEIISAIKQLGGEAVLKPVFSRFASQVYFVNQNNLKHVIHLINVSEQYPYVVQERIIGKSFCSYTVLKDGMICAHSHYPVYFTAGKGASITFEYVEHKGIEQWISTFFSGTNLTGQFAFDFIETENGVLYPLECNPRATSGVHLFKGLPLPKAFLNSSCSVLKPKKSTKVMLILAMLTMGWSGTHFLKWCKTFLNSKDIIWSSKDMKPFFHQFYVYYSFYRLAKKNHISPIQATTIDIEWNGDKQ